MKNKKRIIIILSSIIVFVLLVCVLLFIFWSRTPEVPEKTTYEPLSEEIFFNGLSDENIYQYYSDGVFFDFSIQKPVEKFQLPTIRHPAITELPNGELYVFVEHNESNQQYISTMEYIQLDTFSNSEAMVAKIKSHIEEIASQHDKYTSYDLYHSTVKDGDIKIEDVTTDIIDAILEVDNLQDGITVHFLGDATWNTTMFIAPNTSNNYRIIITYNRILK